MKQFINVFFFAFIALTASAQTKEITLNDIWGTYTFYPQRINDIKHLRDGEHYTTLDDGSIIKHSYNNADKTESVALKTELIDANDKRINIDDYDFSTDETKILIATGSEPIYRHSFIADYYVYNIATKKLTAVSLIGKQRLASFSPDGSKVSFIRDNNLFIKSLNENTETQITFDGKQNSIINGAPDWVYEEELDLQQAYAWSPESNYIAWLRFDESNVKEYSLIDYHQLYPEKFNYKYPKPGESNSIMSLKVYNLTDKTTKDIDLGKETDIYIPKIKWSNSPAQLSYKRLNRLQNHAEIFLVDINTLKQTLIYNETNKYYLETNDNLYFLKDNKRFILLSERDGFQHIYLYSIDGKLIRQLTKGNFDIASINSIDESNNRIYYTASVNSPLTSEIYSINLDGKDLIKLSNNTSETTRPRRFSKPARSDSISESGNYSADFSANANYYISTFSTINSPPLITINNNHGKQIRTLIDNSKLRQITKDYNFAKAQFFRFKTNDNTELNGYMIKPADFDPTKKYPVLMTVYGGPASQTVRDRWGGNDFIWHQMLTRKGYIIVSVDNRGTGSKGEEFRKSTYLQLGKYETDDQIEAAKYLGSLPFIDKSRIGIFGWSYGGFMTTLCLTKGADYFKTGIAVAPVTNWRYYDNIYTERFMRTPKENPTGYDLCSPFNYINNFKGHLLIIHGTADDNVHLQNSMEFIDAMIKANKQPEMFFYPNKNHSIYGGNTRLNLYTKMTEYLLKNL